MLVFNKHLSNYCSGLVLLFVLVFLICTIHEGEGFSSSVPPTRSVCRDMKPGHQQHKIRADPSPYSVSTNVKTVQGGDYVVVALKGDAENKFLGFYVQARDEKNNIVGTFVPNDDAKVHTCAGIRDNAAHHADGKMDKSSVKVIWKAPKSFQGSVLFLATVVKEYDTFWTKIKAPNMVTVSG